MSKTKVNTGNAYNSKMRRRRQSNVFYFGLLALPLLNLIFGTIIVNGNSLLLAFRSIDPMTNQGKFVLLDNFVKVIDHIKSDWIMQNALRNGIRVYAYAVVITAVVPILFSYYVYKKLPLHGTFKVLLFLPSIISPIITVTIYKYIADELLVTAIQKMFSRDVTGFLSDPNKTFNTVLVYYLWMSFGGGLLIQLGAMNSVEKSVTEAAYIDGIGFWRELWHVVLPKTYQVITIGFILGIVSIFTNDLGLYAFFGLSADSRLYTVGYYFTVRTLNADVWDYPFLAAWGLIATAIALPLTFLARHLIYKYGPQE